MLCACAAWRWPGERIDCKRFVELLVRQTPEEFRTSWVSLPSLLNDGKIAITQTPYGIPGNYTDILTDDDDLPFSSALTAMHQVLEYELKKHSFAHLIYERLRCGYAHELLLGKFMNERPATDRPCRVSYILRGEPDPSGGRRTARRIHVGWEYLVSLAQYHVTNLPAGEEPKPPKWWFEK